MVPDHCWTGDQPGERETLNGLPATRLPRLVLRLPPLPQFQLLLIINHQFVPHHHHHHHHHLIQSLNYCNSHNGHNSCNLCNEHSKQANTQFPFHFPLQNV